jgi:hypothetical protein
VLLIKAVVEHRSGAEQEGKVNKRGLEIQSTRARESWMQRQATETGDNYVRRRDKKLGKAIIWATIFQD